MTKQNFITTYYPLARKAGELFGMNPVILLAQSAIETGWGESTLCREYNNFFGITAYGRPNDYWHGGSTDLSVLEGNPSLLFRRYLFPEDSFLDFARLIHSAYPVAATLTFHPAAYAKEIAYSKYISEVNGDNRAAYQRMLVSISRSISQLLPS